MKKIVALGGGENGRLLDNGTYAEYNTEAIDKEIVKITGKTNPHFLFLGHAMQFSSEIEESYFQTMIKIYGDKFGCECQSLKSYELNNKEIVKEKVAWADIIYEGGGDTSAMISLWKETGFDKILYEAWNSGKVICGISAGAVCWFNSCNSDSMADLNSFTNVNCLDWINLYITPHCDEKGRMESTKLQLKDNNMIGIALTNCSALEIIEDKYRIITSKPEAYCKKCFWENNVYYSNKITVTEEMRTIDELLNK